MEHHHHLAADARGPAVDDPSPAAITDFLRSFAAISDIHLADCWALGYVAALRAGDLTAAAELLPPRECPRAQTYLRSAAVAASLRKSSRIFNELVALLLERCPGGGEAMVAFAAQVAHPHFLSLAVRTSPPRSPLLSSPLERPGTPHLEDGDGLLEKQSQHSNEVFRELRAALDVFHRWGAAVVAQPLTDVIHDPAILVPGAPSECLPGASQKKVYEVEHVAQLVEAVARRVAPNAPREVVLIDVGAGQGHLSAALARRGFGIVVIEHDSHQVHGALRRFADFGPEVAARVVVCAASITAQTHAGAFASAVAAALHEGGIALARPSAGQFVLMSLHACGSLSAEMLRLYSEWDRCAAVVNIGCCYNLLGHRALATVRSSDASVLAPAITDATEAADERDFPISRGFASAGASLSRNLKMAACQAPLQWTHNVDAFAAGVTSVFERALVQEFVATTLDVTSLGIIGRVPPRRRAKAARGPDKSPADDAEPLVDYLVRCAAAIQRRAKRKAAALEAGDGQAAAGADAEPATSPDAAPTEDADVIGVPQEALHAVAAAFVAKTAGSSTRQAEMLALYVLRGVIGHVAEAAILLDRKAFISECVPHCEVALLHAFDHRRSARNIAVVAVKKPQKGDG